MKNSYYLGIDIRATKCVAVAGTGEMEILGSCGKIRPEY